jgi:hypothetical protein
MVRERERERERERDYMISIMREKFIIHAPKILFLVFTNSI